MNPKIIKRNYEKGFWSAQVVALAVRKGVLAPGDYFYIVNPVEPDAAIEDMRDFVSRGYITAEEYEQITGETYIA